MGQAAKPGTVPVFPEVTGDFYDLAAFLHDEDRLLLGQVRDFMEKHVAPVINIYWGKAEFPFEVLPAMAELGIAGLAYSGYGCPGRSFLADGFVAMELARIDPSMAGWRWDPSTCAAPRNRRSSGSPQWPAWRRSAPSA